MKVCIYSRVSAGQQDTTKQSVVLSEWAKQRGFEAVQVYEEKESAWKCGRQRVLASLIADTRAKVPPGLPGLIYLISGLKFRPSCGLNALNTLAQKLVSGTAGGQKAVLEVRLSKLVIS